MTTQGLDFAPPIRTPILVFGSKNAFLQFESEKRSALWCGNRLCTRMPITKQPQASRFKSFHDIAAFRGDGLRPELVQLFERLAQGGDTNLSEIVEPPGEFGFETGSQFAELARSRSAKKVLKL